MDKKTQKKIDKLWKKEYKLLDKIGYLETWRNILRLKRDSLYKKLEQERKWKGEKNV